MTWLRTTASGQPPTPYNRGNTAYT